MTEHITINKIDAILARRKPRSAWDRGVREYERELLESLNYLITHAYIPQSALDSPEAATVAMLNGAENWLEYSYCGSALIYDADIANRLCTPSELRKYRDGERNPASGVLWLDIQAKALELAARHIRVAIRTAVWVSTHQAI